MAIPGRMSPFPLRKVVKQADLGPYQSDFRDKLEPRSAPSEDADFLLGAEFPTGSDLALEVSATGVSN